MKAKTKKRYVALAHIDEPELTYRNVDIPHIVPLFANFEPDRHIGSARLRHRGSRIYAILEMNFNMPEYGKTPAVILGVDGGKSVIEDGIFYVDGGVVACASIVSNQTWKEVYGDQEGEVNELDYLG